MAKLNLITILFALMAAALVDPAAASVNWDGPVDAAIDNLAATLQALGFSGAGVRPFGYGFNVEYIGYAATPEDAPQSDTIQVPENAINPMENGELNSNGGN